MRSAATHKLLGVILLLCILPGMAIGQYYINFSSNLPDDDASFQTKDVLAVDIDNDGDLDIILANEFQNNVVLLNNGQGLFTRGNVGIPTEEEHDSEAIAIADFSMNGSQDLIFVSEDDFEHEYYWNNGGGSFTEPPLFLPYTTCRAALGKDFNGDNIPDLMLGNNGQNMMLINNGAGEFINETFDRIPFLDDLTQDLAMSDVDGDGDMDIFVANEDVNRLLINNGSNVYLDESSSRLPQGLNIDSRTVLFEDVDLDGDDDIYLCNVEFSAGKDAKNRLFLNDGQGYFNDVTEAYLPSYTDQTLDAAFTDFNFDGYPDIIVANVLGIPMFAYINNGNGKYTESTNLILGSMDPVEAFGIVAADFNGDGYEDLYVCNREGKDVLLIRDPSVLSNNNLKKLEANLYPNPVTDNFILEGEFSNQEWTFQLFDTNGKMIRTLEPNEVSNHRFEFNTPDDLANGVYFLNAKSTEEVGVFRLVVYK